MKYLMALVLLLLVYTGEVYGHSEEVRHSYSVDYLQGEGDVKGVKFAYQIHVDWLSQYSELLDLYFESSINFWEYGLDNNHDSNFVLALSPVIRYPITKLNTYPLFLEFGIGVSLLDDTQFAGKNVSTHYQFEDRLGIVMKFGENFSQSVALRYFHYSNAGFKSPNPGLDFISFSYSKFF
ncbi:hypothetical protein N473_10145 [Pseudoalteromonas luteoviolacea CPMOR-1]|uniref:Lipid A deacylase n=1 Tax=Pseudoalteromonas luteoviolacea CPMOR-1 TaxID=1365248 RepID=A0A167M7G0_9GAMM|nr:acyloxyacyl hydrolase [Pseudoalteromonas luteoviolacea]KZN65919.1 hypothetical protein N473_10145 [Pseudoalteromonas luteoviolacea CPMOR-1]